LLDEKRGLIKKRKGENVVDRSICAVEGRKKEEKKGISRLPVREKEEEENTS